ncbi:hypothetical protein [Bittarella sp. HCP28S3_D9]|uniref:hypothetical protein n=1 Tax=Bittarella sp. HCP28S3_D9 TaxID=3440253 RepID=UPI003F8BFC78
MKMKRVLSVLLSLGLVAAAVPAQTLAKGEETVRISSSQELVEAIHNQKDGQTWVLEAGLYDLGGDCLDVVANINGVEKGFVFPLFVDDLSIRGEGEVSITSSYDPATGNWAGQNFVTVGGSGVTLENLTLKGNPNSFYDGQCNKAIELMGGKDLTLKDIALGALQAPDGSVSSGSIYISSADAGNTVIEGVEMASWISAKSVTSGSVTVKNVTQDFANNTYAGYSDPVYGYAWNPGVSGDKVSLEGLTIKVDNKSNFVKQISDNLRPGTTVELTEDIAVSEMVYLRADGVSIRGGGHTITAADNFQMGSHGQINLVKVEADGVTLEDLQLVATAANKHALDIWGADGVTLRNVELDHSAAKTGAPLVNNSSNVTIEGTFRAVTGENSWYGVNLDDRYGKATLTFAEGAAVSYESKAAGEKPFVYLELATTKPSEAIVNPENGGLLLDPENGQFVEHSHQYGSWQSDAAEHWKSCECGAESERAAHTFVWVIDKEATETEAGSKHEVCSVCGYARAAVEIPATGSQTTPSDEEQPGDTPEEQPGEGEKADTPTTGDSAILLGAGLAAVLGAAALVVLKRRKASAR